MFDLGEPIEVATAVKQVAAATGCAPAQLQAYAEGLIAGGILESAEASETQYVAGAFATMLGQRGMLGDQLRCNAFDAAIRRAVKPGDIVVDVGSGSGILSLFAARAGAAHVYALELTSIAEDARRVIAANNLSDKITVIQGDAADFKGVERADVMIGEWIGSPWMQEWPHFEAFARVRDRLLAPGGRVIPQKLRVIAGPGRRWRAPRVVWAAPVHEVTLRLRLLSHRRPVPEASRDHARADGVRHDGRAARCLSEGRLFLGVVVRLRSRVDAHL